MLGLGRNGLPAARALAAMGADVVAWDDNVAARVDAADVTLRDLRTDDFAFDALVMSPGIPHTMPAPHPVVARARAWRVPILSTPKCCSARSGRRARTRASSASPAPTASPPPPRCLLTFWQVPGGRSRPAAISARRHWRSDCCRTAGPTSSRCPPTCWSDSPHSASMSRRCSISAWIIWIATATWRDTSRRNV